MEGNSNSFCMEAWLTGVWSGHWDWVVLQNVTIPLNEILARLNGQANFEEDFLLRVHISSSKGIYLCLRL